MSFTNDIDVNKILVSKKVPYGKNNALKYVIGYNDNDVIRPLCLRLSQISGFIKRCKENKKTIITMSLMVKDKKLLKNHDKVWEKIESLMGIDFESKPVYGDDDKNIKTKIKTHADSIITNFHNKKMPIEKAPCKCLSIIMLDSVLKACKKYHPQTFLVEYKYVQEKIKTKNYTDEDLKSDCGSNDETESDTNTNDSDSNNDE